MSDTVFSNTYLIVGSTYECLKNPRKYRYAVQANMCEGDPVIIEEYLYDGKSAYMVINPKNRLDIGVLSAGAAQYISMRFPHAVLHGVLDEQFDGTFRINVYILKDGNSYEKNLQHIPVSYERHDSFSSNSVHSSKLQRKNKWFSLLLCIFTFCGHKFYERKYLQGVLYLFTFGIFGIGWIIDIIAILRKPNPYYI